jgi:hypothetical protein
MTSIAVLSHCEGNVRRLSPEPCVSRSVLNFAYGTFVGGGEQERSMNGLIYLIGLIVVIMAVLSLLGLR